MRPYYLAAALLLIAVVVRAQDTDLGKRYRAGVYFDDVLRGAALQWGYRLGAHTEGTLAVGYAPRRLVVELATDPADPLSPASGLVSVPRAATDVSAVAGVRLSVGDEGKGLYLLPSLQYAYFSTFSDAYLAASAREGAIFRGGFAPEPRPEARHDIALGSEVGYRFHFLRLLYADAALAGRARFGVDDPDAYEMSARIGLGVRF